MNGRDRRGERVHAYLDGELSPRAARRTAAHLARSAEDRAELERARAAGDWVREAEGARGMTDPDLWDAITLRLPAIDAELAEAPPRGRWLPAWRLLAAGAAAAGLVLALGLGLLRGTAPAPSQDVVQWLDSEGAPVMVLEAPGEDTVIWVLGPAADEVSGGGERVSV